jgi:hypothetical protein
LFICTSFVHLHLMSFFVFCITLSLLYACSSVLER